MPPDALAFLIDECLHSSLVDVANAMGYAAHHVEHIGLKGYPDWRLWQRAMHDELVFVTNNAHDFRKLSVRTELHPGVILILPMTRPQIQRQLFQAALEYLKGRTYLINRVIEVDFQMENVEISEIELP